VRRLAVAALTAVMLAGCSGGGGAGPNATGSPDGGKGAPVTREAGSATAQLREMLDRRARALESGDGKDYAATALTRAQKRRDRGAARRARSVGISRIALEAVGGRVKGRRARVDVALRYAIRGVSGTFEARSRMDVRYVGGQWRVVSVRGRERPPWEVGRFVRLRSRHFVVLAPPEVPEAPITEALEAGYVQTGRVLIRPKLKRRYLVVVAQDAAQAHALTELIRGVGGLAAIADAEVRQEGAAERVSEVVSQRLLVVWAQFAGAEYDGRLRVVTHELTHAALAELTSGRTPSWLLEGVALYVSGDRRVAEAAELIAGGGSRAVRRALTLSGLSEPDAIARLDGDGQAAAYAYSSAAAFYIAARYGQKRLLRLYDAFNDEQIEGTGGAALTDLAVREVLGRPLARLERDLRRWIVTRAVVAPLSP
jgi:hypothetical protein